MTEDLEEIPGSAIVPTVAALFKDHRRFLLTGGQIGVPDLPCQAKDDEHGPHVVSAWEISDWDLENLQKYRTLYLHVMGRTHPPVGMFTIDQDLAATRPGHALAGLPFDDWENHDPPPGDGVARTDCPTPGMDLDEWVRKAPKHVDRFARDLMRTLLDLFEGQLGDDAIAAIWRQIMTLYRRDLGEL